MSDHASQKGFNRRTFLYSAGMVSASMFLAACGLKGGSESNSAPGSGVVPTPAAPEAFKGQVIFSNYEWNDPGLAARWTGPADAFIKATPGVTVVKQSVPSTQYWDKMLTETLTGAPVDLYYNTDWRLPQLIEAEALEPFDVHCDVKAINQTYFPGQQGLVKDGKTYGIMVGQTILALWYNKRILEENKVAVPRTIEELFEASKKLTQAPNVYGLGLTTVNATQLMEPVMNFVVGFGGHFARDGKPSATDPKTVEGLRWYKKFVDAGVTPLGQNNPTLRPLMWSGKMAFWIDGAWFKGMVDDNKGSAVNDLATAPMPFPSGATRTAVQCLTMPKSAPNKRNAGAFIDFLSRPEQQIAMLEGSKIMPGRRDGVDYNPFIQKNPWYKAFVDQAAKTVPHTPAGFEKIGAQYEKIVRDNVSDMIARNLDVEQTAAKIQKELEELVSKGG